MSFLNGNLISSPVILQKIYHPLAYTKININVKVGVHNEEFGG